MFVSVGNFIYDAGFTANTADRDAFVQMLRDINISNLRFSGGTTKDSIFTTEAFEDGRWINDPNNLDNGSLFLEGVFEIAIALAASTGADIFTNEIGNEF